MFFISENVKMLNEAFVNTVFTYLSSKSNDC
ncbi:hypothetical protein J2W55_001084 [Mucilaginibacter pocheonensis]|uniref:Uncharacterized protein n=1 Tax=Mucilaginibacter pocheonensis TaxID=398050 RepID=A0ABU1T781_9SPHI|nr:hypothetical protein [Mucilaginibacter pocheonensis]